MKRLLPILAAIAAGCAPAPGDPERDRERDIDALVRGLPETEERLLALGDEAVPSLAFAVKRDRDPRLRARAARALGRVHRATGNRAAAAAYAEAVETAPPEARRELLAHAHLFLDPEGQVRSALTAALLTSKDVTPEMLRSLAAITDLEALDAMTMWLGATRSEERVPGRDIAVRYLGRAARHGRVDAINILTLIEGAPELAKLISDELTVVAGRITVRNWRGWYLDVAKKKRWEWLAEAMSYHLTEAFDATNRAHIDRIVGRMIAGEELEPEFALLEPLLGRRFGYVSPRDVFDPERPASELAEANARAVDTLQAWWRENSPYAWYDARSGRWEVNVDARAAGTPVDPKTGEIVPKDPPK